MVYELIETAKTDPDTRSLVLNLVRKILEKKAIYGGERTIRPLFRLPLRTWNYSVHLLLQQLVWMQDHWHECAADGAPCPLNFNEEERELIDQGAWQFARRMTYRWMLESAVGAGNDGRVPTDQYAEARMLCDAFAQEWNTDEWGPFPFQDGGRSAMNS
uniref:Peptidyl-prolyl cis-trans isomerase (PPIase) (EC) n=1 Tax=Ganoderma boninense TaxID=34458 RepID=A0A5K1K530_9APHY|nr:Peptidyl-prolyl cis-trans isomerase (PPIase) (EC [Ganoderma boninense]